MEYLEEILVLRAKVVNEVFCSSECPFFREISTSSGNTYSCSLFGNLGTDLSVIDIIEDDPEDDEWGIEAELPVRSEHCICVGKRNK